MSYALTVRHGRLALGAISTFNASTSASVSSSKPKASASASASASTTAPSAPSLPKKIPDCSDAAITGGDYKIIDKVFVDCCEKIKGGSGSVSSKLKGIAQCAAKNTARAVGGAVGVAVGAAACVATGVGAVAAPLCGVVGGAIGTALGGFIYDRVSGYSTTQIVGGLAAGAVCAAVSGGLAAPLCMMAAAELIGWLSDSVGPVIEGIFNPSAAKERELAARRARTFAIDATAHAYEAADREYQLLWGNGVHSLKLLYKKAFPTADMQATAKKQLGFGPTYDEIARVMNDAGAMVTPPGFMSDFLAREKSTGGSACAVYDYVDPQTGKWDSYSERCPFSLMYYYLRRLSSAGESTMSRDERVKFEKVVLADILAITDTIYPAAVLAISSVATQIVTVAAVLKQKQLLIDAQNATRDKLADKVLKATVKAEAAARLCGSYSREARVRNLTRVFNEAGIARAVFVQLLQTTKTDPCDKVCGKIVSTASAAGARTDAAISSAIAQAKHAERMTLLLGAAAVAAAGGGAYLLLKRKAA